MMNKFIAFILKHNNIKNLKQLLELILGIFFVFVLFYLRLLPRISQDLWENMTNKQLMITVVILLLILSNIYNLLNILFGQYKPTIFSKIGSKIVTFAISCLKTVYYNFGGFIDTFSEKYFNYSTYYNVMRFCIRWFIKKEYFITNTLILLAMRYLPKIILTLALFIDVIIYQRFHYTFKCIPLLLLPLVEKCIIGIFAQGYEIFFPDLETIIDVEDLPNNVTYSYKEEFEYNPPPNVKGFHDFFFNHYELFVKLKATLDDYQFFCDFTNNIRLDLAIALLRLFIYLYILNYGLT